MTLKETNSTSLVPITMKNNRPKSMESRGSTSTTSSHSHNTASQQSIRSARAVKVFGELVESENSLSYSPSPFPSKQRGLMDITNVSESSIVRELPFCKEDKKNVGKKSSVSKDDDDKDLKADRSVKTNNTSTSKRQEKKGRKLSDKTDIESIDISAITDEKANDKEYQGPSPFESIPLELTPQKPTKTMVEKENDPDNCSQKESSLPKKEDTKNQPPKEIVITKSSSKHVSIMSPKGRKRNLSIAKRKALQTKHRLSGSSKKRRAMMRNAQGALHLATKSVNQTINATREAKEMHLQYVTKQATKLRQEWKFEKEDAVAFFAEAENTKQQLLRIRRDIASDNARAKVENEQCQQQQRLLEVTKEIEFKSSVFVDHKKKLKQDEDNRRRLSTALKARFRKDRKANEEMIHLEKIEEEHESHEMRMGANRDVEEYKKRCAQERRESYAFRNAEGLRQRQEEQERKAEEAFRVHERLEHKWAGEDDAKEYLKLCEQRRRDSFAFRNLEGRRQRVEEAERKADERAIEHERLELKWAGEDDAKKYLEQCARERRDSFAFRNAEAKRQRDEGAERKAEENFIEHERLELKWAGEDDSKEYIKRCEQARRESFAFRGQECVRHRAVMNELNAIAKEKEHEAYMLKWAAQDDVKQYLADEAQKRRMSFAFRNQEGRRHRQLEEQWKYDELDKAHEREVLKSECQKDVEEYKKQCAARDRASFCYRGKELQLQKLRLQEESEKEYELDQERRALETEARGDVEEYVHSCKERRRLSLAFRANESRHHKQWKRQQAEEEREARSKHSRKMALDRRYAELARQKERARNALDAIRHTNCSFSTNPFLSLLG